MARYYWTVTSYGFLMILQACFSSISPTMDTHPISLESDLFHKHSAGRQIYEVSDYQPTILQTLSPPVSGPLLAVPAVPQQHAWVSGTFQPPVMVHPIQQVIQRNSLFQTAVQPIARPKQHNQVYKSISNSLIVYTFYMLLQYS